MPGLLYYMLAQTFFVKIAEISSLTLVSGIPEWGRLNSFLSRGCVLQLMFTFDPERPMRVGHILILTATVLVVAVCASRAIARSWTVEQDGSGDFAAIQPAVDAAASGDTILIGPGWYQELHWVDHYGTPIEVGAYWTDDKDLYFIGTSAAEVKVGPPAYVQHLDGPQGIFQEGLFRNKVFVSSVTFVNLHTGTSSLGSITVEHCVFSGGGAGISSSQGDTCQVTNSSFDNLADGACLFFSCEYAEVSDCDLGAYVYFGSTSSGIIRNCTGTGSGLATYSQSDGIVEDNVLTCTDGPCLVITEGSVADVRRNHLIGGHTGISISGIGTSAVLEQNIIENPEFSVVSIGGGAILQATGNDFIKANGPDGYLVRTGPVFGATDPVVVAMPDNYWADALNGPFVSAFQIGFFIDDYNDDTYLKYLIDFEPFSTSSVPVEEQSLGSLKAMFR